MERATAVRALEVLQALVQLVASTEAEAEAMITALAEAREQMAESVSSGAQTVPTLPRALLMSRHRSLQCSS